MGGDATATMEYLDGGGGKAHIDLLTRKFKRHRVIVLDDLNVIVDADTGDLPFGILVTINRQGFECGAVEFIEGAVTTAGQFLERALIQIRE